MSCRIIIAGICLALVVNAVPSRAFDVSSCQSALEKLRKAAREGEDAAESGEVDCEGCDRCRRSGDLGDDHCTHQCRSCSSYRAGIDLSLMGVESAIRSVAMSCDHDFELDPRKGLEKMQRHLDQMQKRGGAAAP